MKKVLILAVIVTSAIGCFRPHASPRKYHFKNGQVIYPDYAIADTLIVTNAQALNFYMNLYDPASDGDISEIIYRYTKIK